MYCISPQQKILKTGSWFQDWIRISRLHNLFYSKGRFMEMKKIKLFLL